MAIPNTPTTQQVSENIVNQISAQLGQRAPIAAKAFTRVLAKALGGVIVTLYKYGGAMVLQQFVRTASNESIIINGRTINPLAEWGDLSGEGSQRLAVQAQLTVSATVVTQGGVLGSGAQLVGPNGVTYITTGDVLLDAPTISVLVTAAGDQQGGDAAGTIGNLANGTELVFVQPIAALLPNTTVTAQTRTGVDAETTDSYRTRILNRFKARPQGGALADYRIWASTSSAVKAAYPYAGDTPGTVKVYIESSTEADGIPTPGQLAEALNAIKFDSNGKLTRAPVGALPNTFAITRPAYDVTVTGLQVDNPAQVRDNIDAALAEYFLGREAYIVGLDSGVRFDSINASQAGGIVSGIVYAAGGTFTTVSIAEAASGDPVVTHVLEPGEKAKLGTVTYA